MADKPPLRADDVRRVLRELEPLSRDRRIVLVGGQAVAVWAAYFKLESQAAEERLYTSKDIDFEGAPRSARRAGELLGGEVHIPELGRATPNTGVVVFQDSEGIDRELDFISAPHGLDARDVRDTAVQLVVPGRHGERRVRVWVMHPERCMESRVYNVVGLGQSGPIALDQLRRSVTCCKEFSKHLLADDSRPQDERIRAVLKLNERIFRKCVHVRAFRDVVLDLEVDPFEAVVLDDRLPKRFLTDRYPQMVERLTTQRNRSRAQRRKHLARRRTR